MPASTRTRTASSRPYDRRLPTTSPTQSKFNPHLSHQSPPRVSPIDIPECLPDHPGLPTYAEYKRIEAGYLLSLSPRKRDKALITQAMFDKIWDVLHQPDACTIETPQFRFWVRKMFTLSRPATSDAEGEQWTWRWDSTPGTHPRDAELDAGEEEEADLELERAMGIGRADAALLTSAVVLHENRPVAIMEQLYELFCFCHVRAGHGGRDKTCAVIREHYSWVPKELTAQFVKACPTCALKRSGGGDLFVMQRRVVGGGKERRQTTVLESAVGRASPSLGWPTTAGPLDPANPQPCGVRERERLRGTSRDALNFSSPMRGSRTGSAGDGLSCGGWDSVSGPQTPFHALGTSGISPRRFSLDTGITKTEQRSPEKTESLPSLASALSNESLDDDLKLSKLESRNDVGGCLPPALRPLRLSGPVPPNASTSEDSDLFPIDPVLLSFSYPGLHGASPGRLSGCGSLASTGLSGTSKLGSQNRGMNALYDRLRVHRVRENGEGDHNVMPALAESPAKFERGELVDASPSPSRYGRLLGELNEDYNEGGYGYPHMDDGPLRVRLLPCRGSTGTESSTGRSPGVSS